jgi:hypothetical protein
MIGLDPDQNASSVDGSCSVIYRFTVICCVAASTAQKKAQPRGAALKFHQRRRFWRICADVCKDTQHGSDFAMISRPVKRFLLLRNINFVAEQIRITKSKPAFMGRP